MKLTSCQMANVINFKNKKKREKYCIQSATKKANGKLQVVFRVVCSRNKKKYFGGTGRVKFRIQKLEISINLD